MYGKLSFLLSTLFHQPIQKLGLKKKNANLYTHIALQFFFSSTICYFFKSRYFWLIILILKHYSQHMDFLFLVNQPWDAFDILIFIYMWFQWLDSASKQANIPIYLVFNSSLFWFSLIRSSKLFHLVHQINMWHAWVNAKINLIWKCSVLSVFQVGSFQFPKRM